jgi:hypothetical protein
MSQKIQCIGDIRMFAIWSCDISSLLLRETHVHSAHHHHHLSSLEDAIGVDYGEHVNLTDIIWDIMDGLSHKTFTDLVSTQCIIFSCGVCQRTLDEIYPLPGPGEHLGRPRVEGVRLWMTDCSHVTCSEHIQGGGKQLQRLCVLMLMCIRSTFSSGGYSPESTMSNLSESKGRQ